MHAAGAEEQQPGIAASGQTSADGGSQQEQGRQPGKQPRYERWTKERLYARAKEVGIGGRSSMNKQALIDALRHH